MLLVVFIMDSKVLYHLLGFDCVKYRLSIKSRVNMNIDVVISNRRTFYCGIQVDILTNYSLVYFMVHRFRQN